MVNSINNLGGRMVGLSRQLQGSVGVSSSRRRATMGAGQASAVSMVQQEVPFQTG